MATQYMITTNGVDFGPRYSSKARAIVEAEKIGTAAEARGHGDVITVQTVKTSKVVWTETYYARTPKGMKFGTVGSAAAYAAEMDESEECTCSKGAPSPGNMPCLHCGGDNSWCAKHYPAPQFMEADGNDTYVSPAFPNVTMQGESDVPVITTADGVVESESMEEFETRHAAYVANLMADPDVMRMMAAESAEKPSTGYVGVMQQVPGFVAEEHIHAAGCRDIQREMKKFGQKDSDTFPYPADFTVWDVIENNDGGRASDNYTEGTLEHAQEMVWNANAEIRIMPCAASMPLGMTPFGPLVDGDGGYMISEEMIMDVPEFVHLTVTDPINNRVLIENGQFPADWDDAMIRTAVAIDHTGNGLNGFAYVITRNTHAPSTTEFPNERAYKSGTENANDGARDMGAPQYGTEWQKWFRSSYNESMRIQEEEAEEIVSRMVPDEDDVLMIMGNADQPLMVEAHIMIDVDGFSVDLGWHVFEIPALCEKSVATLYGERHGEWKRPGAADWDSVITVTESYTL